MNTTANKSTATDKETIDVDAKIMHDATDAAKKVIDETVLSKKEANKVLLKKVLSMTAVVTGSVFLGMVIQRKLDQRANREAGVAPEVLEMNAVM